jgi:hypothetical protein
MKETDEKLQPGMALRYFQCTNLELKFSAHLKEGYLG